VFSNAVLHWIQRADAIIEGVYRRERAVMVTEGDKTAVPRGGSGICHHLQTIGFAGSRSRENSFCERRSNSPAFPTPRQ
jgi:hypothetical protein